MGGETEWHFFHCLTQYGEVARFVWLKSASGDIHPLLLIQTLAVLSPSALLAPTTPEELFSN